MNTPTITTALFLAAHSALSAAVIHFTVNGTADSTGYGYTAGQAVSFTYTLNDYAPTTPVGWRDSIGVGWYDERTSDPELWSGVVGTGVAGTWTRPATEEGSPFSYLEVYENGALYLYAGTDHSPSDTGITVNGEAIYGVYVSAVYSGFIPTIPGSLPDPTAYFKDYVGTYAVARSDYGSIGIFGGSIPFTPQSLTISEVPEPSTWLAAGFLGLVLFGQCGRCLLSRHS